VRALIRRQSSLRVSPRALFLEARQGAAQGVLYLKAWDGAPAPSVKWRAEPRDGILVTRDAIAGRLLIDVNEIALEGKRTATLTLTSADGDEVNVPIHILCGG